jgi:hypothetical protein
MRKFVQGVLEIRSLKLGAIKAWSRGHGAWEAGAKSKEQGQGASNAARFGYRLSVLGYQVDKGEQNYRTSGRRTRRAAVLGYPIYEQEQQLEMIGG